MRVVEIRDELDLRRLEPAWETLLRYSGSNTIFLTWEWLSAWWRAYGVAGDLRILAAFDEKNTLRGIAPLRREKVRKYGVTRLVWSFAGDGSNDSDYLDFIIAQGFERDVLEAFSAHWTPKRIGGAVLSLNEIPASSPCLPLLKELAAPAGNIWTEEETPCGILQLPQTWDDYLMALRPRFRTKIRSVLRNLENHAEVRFGFCTEAEEIERTLPVLFDLHARRWAQDGKPGVFGWKQKRDFYAEISALCSKRGWLRFSWLEWNGRILACQYGFAYEGTYFHLQEGYEPVAEHWNVGIGLRAWTIRRFIEEGLREYDFLNGLGRHKTDWGAVRKTSKQVQIARDSIANSIFCRGLTWEVALRETIRNAAPEKVLSLRERYLKARQLAAVRRNQTDDKGQCSTKTRILQAAANCYFYSGFPLLTRSFRQHWQVSLSSHQKGPKISWHRRTEPSARILYYHRVNDERDPFFPAISTKLFEQQMQFVSRHYKVAPLSKLLTHLEEGSPGIVVSITFDDGYRDNYQNAFPILQRYNLPATVFLTTGSIDSRQPLWFEQLAQALKRTGREFLELEIEIPRRFWMRTDRERIESGQQVFRLLRTLPDSERTEWLQRILRQLAIGDGGERKDKMLVWDEVRAMKAHGIDFGGHTVTHPFLSTQTHQEAAWEIRECKRRIEEEIQSPVEHFAYPNGGEEDFSAWHKEFLSRVGYRAAMTTKWGVNYQSTDRLELRRGGPWEENAALFACKFDWYQLTNA